MTSFTLLDAVGMAGVVLMLIAYGATVSGRMDPLRPAALGMNLAGSVAVLVSLTGAFNWSAAVIEGAWAVIAAAGLVRWLLRRSLSPSGAFRDGHAPGMASTARGAVDPERVAEPKARSGEGP